MQNALLEIDARPFQIEQLALPAPGMEGQANEIGEVLSLRLASRSFD
jgi:hypothetical protein